MGVVGLAFYFDPASREDYCCLKSPSGASVGPDVGFMIRVWTRSYWQWVIDCLIFGLTADA